MSVETLLSECDHVLVAFDGPIAELPATESIADRLRVLIADGRPPRKVARTNDPFVVLAYATTIGPATERAVYAQLCRIEREVVAGAHVAPGVGEAMAAMTAAGTRVTVVSSLDTAAVRMFLVMHGLVEYVRHLATRTGPDRSLLPPAPNLITTAIAGRAMESGAFVGRAAADLTAARAAGVTTIRYHRRLTAPAPPPVNPWFEALSADQSRQNSLPSGSLITM